VITDHPSDYPHDFVARLWIGDEVSETDVICAHNLGALRSMLHAKGYHQYARHPSDKPEIVESWI